MQTKAKGGSGSQGKIRSQGKAKGDATGLLTLLIGVVVGGLIVGLLLSTSVRALVVPQEVQNASVVASESLRVLLLSLSRAMGMTTLAEKVQPLLPLIRFPALGTRGWTLLLVSSILVLIIASSLSKHPYLLACLCSLWVLFFSVWAFQSGSLSFSAGSTVQPGELVVISESLFDTWKFTLTDTLIVGMTCILLGIFTTLLSMGRFAWKLW